MRPALFALIAAVLICGCISQAASVKCPGGETVADISSCPTPVLIPTPVPTAQASATPSPTPAPTPTLIPTPLVIRQDFNQLQSIRSWWGNSVIVDIYLEGVLFKADIAANDQNVTAFMRVDNQGSTTFGSGKMTSNCILSTPDGVTYKPLYDVVNMSYGNFFLPGVSMGPDLTARAGFVYEHVNPLARNYTLTCQGGGSDAKFVFTRKK